MFWKEHSHRETPAGPGKVQDLSFRITCRELPTDHAWSLYREIRRIIPWIEHEPHAGIHGIHGAASGNGWQRPASGTGNVIQLSQRTRLTLRLPEPRIREAARALENRRLDIAGFPLETGSSRCRKLSPFATVFARSVSSDHINEEKRFTHEVLEILEALDIRPDKILCGLAHTISVDTACLHAKSVLISGLAPHESVIIQESGLGKHRLLGCGILLPHKSLLAVHETDSG